MEMKNRAFIIASFGDRRKQVQRLVKNIRSYVDYTIHIITTEDSDIGSNFEANVYVEFIERLWPKGSYRADIRNSNYLKVRRALYYSQYDSVCLLDDDMFIVNKGFVDGFRFAEQFGAAVPINPRIYVKYNAMGADVQQSDIVDISYMPMNAPACNFSPFFYSARHQQAIDFLRKLANELKFKTCRGTLAIWKASWATKYAPVYLPEQFCVCGKNAEYIKDYSVLLKGQQVKIPVMCLHLGHKKVAEVFKDMIQCL